MGLDPRLVRLVASVGTVLNQDGTVIYLTVTVLFYAQKTFDSYDFGQHALVGCVSEKFLLCHSCGVRGHKV